MQNQKYEFLSNQADHRKGQMEAPTELPFIRVALLFVFSPMGSLFCSFLCEIFFVLNFFLIVSFVFVYFCFVVSIFFLFLFCFCFFLPIVELFFVFHFISF